MTKPKVYERDSEEIMDEVRQLIGDHIHTLKGRKDLTDMELLRLERAWRMLLGIRKEERESAREQVLDELKKEDLHELVPQAMNWLKKKAGT